MTMRKHPILRGTGLNPQNLAQLERLEKSFPRNEYLAIAGWLNRFYGFQQNWLLDSERFAALVKCRQIGASHTFAAAAILWALHGETTSIVSIGQREADDVLDKVGKHAKILTDLGSRLAHVVAKSTTRIVLATDGTVASLPSTSGGRGKSGNVLLDEAAYYEHPEEVWDGASATSMHGYRMRVMSTPNGVGNMFHALVKNHESMGFKLHRTNIHEAMADGLRVSLADCMKMAKGDPRLFSQLFECKFLDGDMQYIPSFLLEECQSDDLVTTDGAYFAGLDIGKKNDRTVLTVLRKVYKEADPPAFPTKGYYYYLQHIETHKRTDDAGLDRMVAGVFSKYKLRRLALDATGMGAFPADRMQRRYGISKVDPISFTLQVKEELATALYTGFCERRVRIPKTDKVKGMTCCQLGEPDMIFEDLASLRRIITTAGNVRYDAPHTEEGHADRAWSLALALHAAMNAPTYVTM